MNLSLFGPLGRPGGACERDARARGATPLIVGYGGGVNSLAVLLGLRERGIRPDLVSFADTGDEHRETYSFLSDVLVPWLAANDLPPLTIVKNAAPMHGDKSLGEESLRRKTLPSRAFGMSSCAFRWKIEPQNKFLNHWQPAIDAWARGEKPIKILGYDAGETHRSDVEQDKKLRYWYALREWDWDRATCEKKIRDAGLPLPPKSSCVYCPSKKKSEILAFAKRDPEAFAYALKIEATALSNTENPLTDVKGLGRTFAWRDLVQADPATLAKMPEATVESCTICTETEDDE